MRKIKITHQRLFILGVLHFLFMVSNYAQEKEEASFSYRESYFPLVSAHQDFQKEYETMPLDIYWGLWGHNLPKLISAENETGELYALISDKRDKEQFCFSSTGLKEILVENIEKSKESYKYYMIAPNDNLLVCQCGLCIKNGNTLTNAAPAVFQLLDDLAEDYPSLHFFTTAYLSINQHPKEKPKENVGVFFSTINYQKGKPFNQIPQKNNLIEELEKWNTSVNNLFVWEYALNYDNYLDFYPNLKNFQQNSKFLKAHHVNGIFVNGSESYSALQEIKCSVIASLLSDVNIDVDQLIQKEFKKRFPEDVAQSASEFYKNLTTIFFNSKEEMSIYSGIKDTKNKYLDYNQLEEFYLKMLPLAKKHKNNLNTQALMLSTVFLKLELMRASGIKQNGYGIIEKKQVKLKPEVKKMLDYLNQLSLATGILTYNEQGSSISNYINLWNKEIIQKDEKNYFLEKDFRILSKLDEGYNDKTILNDGSYGFLDYNTNWLINTLENLKIEIPISQISFGMGTISMGFLNDPKHDIFFPTEIELKNEGKLIKKIKIPASTQKEKKQISIPIFFKNYKNSLVIEVKRLENSSKKTATACDEIIIN